MFCPLVEVSVERHQNLLGDFFLRLHGEGISHSPGIKFQSWSKCAENSPLPSSAAYRIAGRIDFVEFKRLARLWVIPSHFFSQGEDVLRCHEIISILDVNFTNPAAVGTH